MAVVLLRCSWLAHLLPSLSPNLAAFPGCGAARSGAPLIRDRSGLGVCYDPGSATHHFAPLRAALRPGNESLCGFCAADGTGSRLTVRLAPNFVSLNPDYACYLSG